MQSVQLVETTQVGDILDTSSYRFVIGQIPNSGGLGAGLDVQCTQAVYPGSTNETFAVQFSGGHELTYSGRRVFPKTLSLTYVEKTTMLVTTVFGGWLEYIRGTNTGNASGYKSAYALNGPKLYIFDLTGYNIDTITWYGLQITERPDITFEPSGQAATINITMAYDYYYSTLFGPSANSSDNTNNTAS